MERGEAEKIIKIKQAEGGAESKILQGKGMAGQRKAIIDGLRESLGELQTQVRDANAQEVMSLLLMAQYFDTLKEMGGGGKMNTILIPHSPSSVQELYNQIRNTIITANQVET
jgi:regulator of protease activity HflC (stomatin/prohibitin superfamily)